MKNKTEKKYVCTDETHSAHARVRYWAIFTLKKSPLAPLCPGYIHFLTISFYCEIFGCGRARVAATPPPQFSEVATTHKHQSEEGAG